MTEAVALPPGVPVNVPGGLSAAIIDAPGAAPRPGTVVLPPRRPGTTLVSVLAAPLNPLDLVIASGAFHSARHELPYVPGSECTGTVVESDHYPAGSRVYAECHASPASPGAFATQVLVNDEDLLPLPDGVDPVLAAAVGNSGTAAFLPLIEDARLRAGETVLVLGATGAVGQIAVQLARQHAARRVIGAGRNRAVLEHVLGLGADAVVDLRPDEGEDELAVRLLAAAGPVDVVLDGLFGLPLQAALCVRTAGAGGQHRQPLRGDGAAPGRPAARQAAHRVRLRRPPHPAARQTGCAELAVGRPRLGHAADRHPHLHPRPARRRLGRAGGLPAREMRHPGRRGRPCMLCPHAHPR